MFADLNVRVMTGKKVAEKLGRVTYDIYLKPNQVLLMQKTWITDESTDSFYIMYMQTILYQISIKYWCYLWWHRPLFWTLNTLHMLSTRCFHQNSPLSRLLLVFKQITDVNASVFLCLIIHGYSCGEIWTLCCGCAWCFFVLDYCL